MILITPTKENLVREAAGRKRSVIIYGGIEDYLCENKERERRNEVVKDELQK